MFSFKGRTALITGAATGIGQTIAIKFAEAGCNVIVTDKPDISLEETVNFCEPFGSEIIAEAMDIRDLDQIKSVIQKVEKAGCKIDILVNNAGINKPLPADSVDLDNWDDHFNTNVRGGFFCSQAVAKNMIKNKFGRIIFISSQSGLIGIPGQAVYCATKGAIINLVRTLGVEWAKHNITVNSVAPTFVETNLTRERLKDPDFKKFVLGKIPSGKLALTEDVAHAVLYLASEGAGMVNAFTLAVDGGWTAW